MTAIYKASHVALHVRVSNRAALNLYKDALGFSVKNVEKKYCEPVTLLRRPPLTPSQMRMEKMRTRCTFLLSKRFNTKLYLVTKYCLKFFKERIYGNRASYNCLLFFFFFFGPTGMSADPTSVARLLLLASLGESWTMLETSSTALASFSLSRSTLTTFELFMRR